MKSLLKIFSIDTLIDFVTTWLASTIKRPNSVEAMRAIDGVKKLQKACDDFLSKVEVTK